LFLRFPILVLFLQLSFSTLSIAQLGPPAADTYSASGSPSTNFGTATTLEVATGHDVYIQFNLTPLPAGISVSNATLRLHVNSVTTAGSFDVYQLNRSWAETTLTYNKAPALGTSATGVHPVALTTSSAGEFLVIDITPDCSIPGGCQ
jgi:hypothetical protein